MLVTSICASRTALGGSEQVAAAQFHVMQNQRWDSIRGTLHAQESQAPQALFWDVLLVLGPPERMGRWGSCGRGHVDAKQWNDVDVNGNNKLSTSWSTVCLKLAIS